MSRDTPLRATPDRQSKIIATLSFDIVKLLSEEGHVRTADGRVGWVDRKLIWSPMGYRIVSAVASSKSFSSLRLERHRRSDRSAAIVRFDVERAAQLLETIAHTGDADTGRAATARHAR